MSDKKEIAATEGITHKLGFDGIDLRGRRYTGGTKRGQRAVRGASRGALRISEAVTDGLEKYWKKSNQSSWKKRDGAIRDLPRNLARALEVSLKGLGKAPNDVAKRLGTGKPYKGTRRLLRLFRW